MRFTIEHVKTIRNAVGTDFPIVILLGASDYLEKGLTNLKKCWNY